MARTYRRKDGVLSVYPVSEYQQKWYQERGRGRKRDLRAQLRALSVQQKIERGACEDCGIVVTQDNHVIFDWDHRDPIDKLHTVAQMGQYESESLMLAEIAKCDLRCANCHRLRTWREKHWLGSVKVEKAVMEPDGMLPLDWGAA